MSKWLPIDTAPRKGLLLLFSTSREIVLGERMFFRGWICHGVKFKKDAQGRLMFTHWMPLPEPPDGSR